MSSSQSKEQEAKDNNEYSKNFTRIPNILFASYKHLSKEEKFLYCTLRQVYWDARPRFVSLRDLSELTGYSVGALSKMLPRLHTCGLIHKEIRKEKGKDGKEKGNAKYHITIPDIWEINREYFSCSPNERTDPSEKLVHQMTQACSPNDTSLFTKSDKVVPFGEQDQAQVEHAKDTLKTSLKKERKTHSSIPSISLSSEEQRVYDFACSELFKANSPRITPKLKEECENLAKHVKTLEQFQNLLAFVRALPYIKGQIHLKNLVNALNGWLQTQYKPTQGADKPIKQSSDVEKYKAKRNRILAQAGG